MIMHESGNLVDYQMAQRTKNMIADHWQDWMLWRCQDSDKMADFHLRVLDEAFK